MAIADSPLPEPALGTGIRPLPKRRQERAGILALAKCLARRQARWDGTPTRGAAATEIAALECAIAEQRAENLSEATIQLMLARALIERWQEGPIENEAELRHNLASLVGLAFAQLRQELALNLTPYGGNAYVP